MATMIQKFQAARRVSAPLVAIKTFDATATMASLLKAVSEQAPQVRWDAAGGFGWLNAAGGAALDAVLDGAEPSEVTFPAQALTLARKLPAGTVLFAFNLHRYLTGGPGDPAGPLVIQAVANLRDEFKTNRRTLVILCPSITIPPEIGSDVLVLDEPLPDREAVAGIVKDIHKAAKLDAPEPKALDKAVDALRGLPAFPAEQATAMSLDPKSRMLDIEALWERKRAMIEETPGLSVWRGGESFADVGGVRQAKKFLTAVRDGRDAPRAVVFIDEIEKALAGATGVGDSSGVSQSQLMQLLVFMQDRQASGSIFVGPPGAAKSMLAKAFGAEAGIPTIALDLGAMKGSLVGESEARLRTALKVIDAVADGNALFIATSNNISALPPELKRRFTYGTFFFDLPDKEERQAIWKLYLDKFELLDKPDIDKPYTGAEIRQACLLAYRLRMSVLDAGEFIVPVAVSAAETIDKLRRQANGKYLSASHPGVYRFAGDGAVKQKRRSISTEDETSSLN